MATFKRRVAYLESTGTQWIDTGIAASRIINFDIYCKYEITSGAITGLSNEGSGYPSNLAIYFGRTSSGFINTDSLFSFESPSHTINDELSACISLGSSSNTANISIYKNRILINSATDVANAQTGGNQNLAVFKAVKSWWNEISNTVGKVAYYKIFDRSNNSTIIELIPALDTDNVPCMYDTVSKICFYNQGTGMFKYEELPSRYPFDRLEYLESTGTQYIDTGLTDYVQSHLYRLVNTVAFTSTEQSQTGANGVLQVIYNAGRFGISFSQLNYTIAVNEVFTYEEYSDDQNTTTLIVNGVSSLRNWGSNNYGGRLLLGALIDSQLTWHYSFMRCYGLKIYSSATGFIVCNLIPVLWHANVPYTDGNTNTSVTPTTDIPGMYDTVSRKLFVNQGTGQFLYGVSNLPTYRTHIPHPMNQLGVNEKDKYFTIDLNITSDNLQFGVTPYWNTGGYCKIVDWGDGNSTDATTSGTQLTHTYSTAGKYRVKVIGSMYRFRVGSTNPGAVIDANGNWEALGEITDGSYMFEGCTNAKLASIFIPSSFSRIYRIFSGCNAAVCDIKEFPNSLLDTQLSYTFNECHLMRIDLDSISQKKDGVWDSITLLAETFTRAGNGNSPGTVVGSIAGFLRKFPNVNNVINTFIATNTTTFGSNDYFSITLTTTSPNFVWGFTPYSSEGTWYCFDWGDNTPITSNKNLATFTNNTRITHTFSTPGTYTIKLAMNADTIEFDVYDSDNGAFDMLGNPVINGTLNTTMNFISYDPESEEILIGNEIEYEGDTIEVGGGFNYRNFYNNSITWTDYTNIDIQQYNTVEFDIEFRVPYSNLGTSNNAIFGPHGGGNGASTAPNNPFIFLSRDSSNYILVYVYTSVGGLMSYRITSFDLNTWIRLKYVATINDYGRLYVDDVLKYTTTKTYEGFPTNPPPQKSEADCFIRSVSLTCDGNVVWQASESDLINS